MVDVHGNFNHQVLTAFIYGEFPAPISIPSQELTLKPVRKTLLLRCLLIP